MTTDDLTKHFPVDPDHLRRLHARLERNAQAGDLLDIAYRTVDSAVGPLLLAATPRGLLRVAFANEDHDSVLQDLASAHQPAGARSAHAAGSDRATTRRIFHRPAPQL